MCTPDEAAAKRRKNAAQGASPGSIRNDSSPEGAKETFSRAYSAYVQSGVNSSTSMAISCLPPIADANSNILILGSMPGAKSLEEGRYYAHDRNLFWKIIGELLGLNPKSNYGDRVVALRSAGIALWDVLESCVREGSLDSK